MGNQPTTFLLLCSGLLIVFDQPVRWGQLAWIGLLSMSTALITGLPFWWPIATGAPMVYAIIRLRNHLFLNNLWPMLVLALFLFLDLGILRPLALGHTAAMPYTIGIISGNILITMLFSLKLKTGKVGQSLTLA